MGKKPTDESTILVNETWQEQLKSKVAWNNVKWVNTAIDIILWAINRRSDVTRTFRVWRYRPQTTRSVSQVVSREFENLSLRRSKRIPCRSAPVINTVPYWKINHARHTLERMGGDPSMRNTSIMLTLQLQMRETRAMSDNGNIQLGS
jgi:hypothetical protein